MSANIEHYREVLADAGKDITLVAVSKTKPVEDIRELYDLGQRDFGENYVQELVSKEAVLPEDIRWHFIGHLQSNKVKYIMPFVHLIQGVDSYKLLKEIDKQAAKHRRMANCLLQVHIAKEETKFGFDESELEELMRLLVSEPMDHIQIKGLMGMATLTGDAGAIKNEYAYLAELYKRYSRLSVANCRFSILSMGMSGDYKVAIAQGSNMIRVGSLLFGKRTYPA